MFPLKAPSRIAASSPARPGKGFFARCSTGFAALRPQARLALPLLPCHAEGIRRGETGMTGVAMITAGGRRRAATAKARLYGPGHGPHAPSPDLTHEDPWHAKAVHLRSPCPTRRAAPVTVARGAASITAIPALARVERPAHTDNRPETRIFPASISQSHDGLGKDIARTIAFHASQDHGKNTSRILRVAGGNTRRL